MNMILYMIKKQKALYEFDHVYMITYKIFERRYM